MERRKILAVAIPALLATAANAAVDSGAINNALRIEEMRIIGEPEDAARIAGSAYVIDEVELQTFEYTDINRMLRQAPGVYAQEEEGFGLRPNLRIRGAGGDRNQKITVMEDGVLVAPAPYADPGAYYFPSAARLAGIEVLKGPQTLRYGPYTVGGAVNLVSTPIPDQLSGLLNLEFGQYGERRQHGWVGGMSGQWGFLLEVHNHSADGFQDIDRSDHDTGFDKQDVIAKLRWRSAEGATLPQQIDLKLNYADETSDQSYLGVTDAQFERDPHRRYGVTVLDRMDNEQVGAMLRHRIDFSDDLSLSSMIYRNDFERAWYKVDRIGGASLAGVIENANGGDADSLGWLEGTVDVDDIRIKDNAREYYGEGVQFELSGRLQTGAIGHEWVSGVRWHEDESDRFQPNYVFNQVDGTLVPDRVILPTGGDNRIDGAEALSFWLLDQISLGAVTLTPSLRYEDIETDSKSYADVGRGVVASRLDNSADEWLAGLGITWQLAPAWQLIGGVHQGFAPANAGQRDGTEPEESVNYEFGTRFRQGDLGIDLIAFYSDYENTVRNCTLANPCDGGITFGSESLGESKVQGVELAIDAALWRGDAFSVPLHVAYTYTDAEISEDSDDGELFDGDVMEYIPEHLLNVTVGLLHSSGAGVNLGVSHVDEMCVDFSCDRPGVDDRLLTTDAFWSVDLAANYPVNDSIEVYGRIDNLLDDESIVSRSPAGARANKPRTGYVGLRLRF